MSTKKQRIIQVIALVLLPLTILGMLLVSELTSSKTAQISQTTQKETTDSSTLIKETTISATEKKETTAEAEKEETTQEAAIEEIAGTTIHIDASHANIGRLFNLWQVKESLQGKTIAYGETLSFNKTIELSSAGLKYMYGYTVTSVFPAGGVCGASSALAGEIDRVSNGLIRSDDGGRHPASYHATGGLYWNLPNVAVYFDGYKHTDLRVSNTNPEVTYKIQVTTNYDDLWEKIGVDLNNWQASGSRWEEYLDPQIYTGTDEFQFTIRLQKL